MISNDYDLNQKRYSRQAYLLLLLTYRIRQTALFKNPKLKTEQKICYSRSNLGEKIMTGLIKSFKNWFKPSHPYAPIAYIGRKNFQQIMDCKVTKLKHLKQQTN